MPDREGLSPKARVFFALWPDAAARERLNRIAGEIRALRGGRRVRRETLHLTLVFLGDVVREALTELRECAAGVSGNGFAVSFDRLGCWRHNRIAYLTASRPPAELMDLVASLEAALHFAGFRFDRRSYQPHITLVREADCTKDTPAVEPIVWAARGFVLLESSLRPEGASYAELGRYQLH